MKLGALDPDPTFKGWTGPTQETGGVVLAFYKKSLNPNLQPSHYRLQPTFSRRRPPLPLLLPPRPLSSAAYREPQLLSFLGVVNVTNDLFVPAIGSPFAPFLLLFSIS
ncbi:hypothetical protein LINPERHAP1_LOCUS4635 [Linum perenne]